MIISVCVFELVDVRKDTFLFQINSSNLTLKFVDLTEFLNERMDLPIERYFSDFS